MCLLLSLLLRTLTAFEKKHKAWHACTRSSTYHTAKVGDCCVFVRIGIQQHLSVCVKGEVSPDVHPVFSEESGYSFHFRLRFWERSTVCIITRVHRSSFICKIEKKMGDRVDRQEARNTNQHCYADFFFCFYKHMVWLSNSSNFSFTEINTETSKVVQASMHNRRVAWIGNRCWLCTWACINHSGKDGFVSGRPNSIWSPDKVRLPYSMIPALFRRNIQHTCN